MIWAAAEAGADYGKIQTMFADDLTFRPEFEEGLTRNGTVEAIRRPYRPEYDRLKKLEFPTSEYAWYVEECGRAGLRPLTTVFARGRVDEVARFPWPAVKVASYDCASYPLLRDLTRHFRRLIVSTGATRDDEIEEAARVLQGADFTFLHCVTIYPTPLDQLHLARMEFLRRLTSSVGFSDHTLAERDGIKASVVALHLGADVIERHFTLLPPDGTKDGPVSITPEQLRSLCRLAHGGEGDREAWVREHVGDYRPMIGQARRELTHAELLNRDYYRGRFAARLPTGQVLYNWETGPPA
ncbi:MAG: N-acetylneuraminate synthase family protein [Nitrospirae bacterium]|nr:N-acetylneuraminate synthase family protein [Nitrospirota bacterium]